MGRANCQESLRGRGPAQLQLIPRGTIEAVDASVLFDAWLNCWSSWCLPSANLARVISRTQKSMCFGEDKDSQPVQDCQPLPSVDSDRLAYVIFTSGSTGKGPSLPSLQRASGHLNLIRQAKRRGGDAPFHCASGRVGDACLHMACLCDGLREVDVTDVFKT